jgi:hypothetical protein
MHWYHSMNRYVAMTAVNCEIFTEIAFSLRKLEVYMYVISSINRTHEYVLVGRSEKGNSNKRNRGMLNPLWLIKS